jgi:hypothetical protein
MPKTPEEEYQEYVQMLLKTTHYRRDPELYPVPTFEEWIRWREES